METATIRVWHDERGYGFAEPHFGGPHVFVHARLFEGDARPVVGSQVQIEVATAERGPKATRARLLGGGA